MKNLSDWIRSCPFLPGSGADPIGLSRLRELGLPEQETLRLRNTDGNPPPPPADLTVGSGSAQQNLAQQDRPTFAAESIASKRSIKKNKNRPATYFYF